MYKVGTCSGRSDLIIVGRAMAWLILTSTFVCFILNFSINVSAEITDNLFYNPDLNMAMQKIEELHTLIRKQEEHMLTLEQRSIESQNTAKKQSDRIARLEARIQELDIDVKTQNDASETTEKGLSSGTQLLNPLKSFIKRGIFFIFLYCYIFHVFDSSWYPISNAQAS